MPTYEYICTNCQNAWEEMQKISEPAIDTCPKCHQKTARRQISAGNFILKGGGWYADLYSSSKPSGNKDTASSPSSDTHSDTKVTPVKESVAPSTTAAPASTTPKAPSGGSSGGSSKE